MGAPEAVRRPGLPDGVPDTEEDVLRVSATTPPQELAAAIAYACYEGKAPTLRAIGAGAVNQAVKACAVARQFVSPRAMDLTIKPGFQTITMPEGKEISAVLLRVLID